MGSVKKQKFRKIPNKTPAMETFLKTTEHLSATTSDNEIWHAFLQSHSMKSLWPK